MANRPSARAVWYIMSIPPATGSDTGNTYYVRSTDNGSTWSAPLKLNTDATTRVQWMPSLAVTVNGKLMASWYDRRNTINNDYQRYAHVSLDNGLTWQPDQPISDQIIPQPAQPDPNVEACYAGDYDYSSATGQTIYSAWTDGRIQIGGVNQQDVYLDKVNFEANIPVCTAVGAYGWSAVAALPKAVYGPGVTADGTYVYAAGGYDIRYRCNRPVCPLQPGFQHLDAADASADPCYMLPWRYMLRVRSTFLAAWIILPRH